MKGTVVALDRLADGRGIAALLVDGTLADLIVDAPPARGTALPGAIFRAVPDRPVKNQGGMFVRLADGQQGFLREAKGVAPGKPLIVQVTTVAEPGKAVPVTRKVTHRSRLGLVTPGRPGVNVSRAISGEAERARLQQIGEACLDGRDFGLILRTAAAGADEADIREELVPMIGAAALIEADLDGGPELLLDAPPARSAAWQDFPDADLFDPDEGSFERHGIWEFVTALLSPEAPLHGGASMVIEPTRALVAVDVNTGADTSPAAGLKANVAAIRALPGALRLRGLGGMVTVDLAPFPKKERASLAQVAAKAMRLDAGEMHFAGWTPLGCMEFQRKRDRVPLKEALRDVLPDL